MILPKESVPKRRGMVGDGTLTLDIRTEVSSYIGHLWSLGHLTTSQHLTFFSPREMIAEERIRMPGAQ